MAQVTGPIKVELKIDAEKLAKAMQQYEKYGHSLADVQRLMRDPLDTETVLEGLKTMRLMASFSTGAW